jgi:hypothetical protein
METSIEYHKLLVGAFDSQDAYHENNELVIGNRWSFHDLNSYIRENETWFNFHSHSALGGCCSLHPADTPIFPEEFSVEKLLRFKARLGSYHFSCQFLNNPCSPEDADFKPEWLKYFETYRDIDGRLTIKHEVDNGLVRKDLKVGHLSIAMAVDPNHSGNAAAGRCRHAIVVVGKVDSSTGDDLGSKFYLLDTWAAHATYDAFFDQVYTKSIRRLVNGDSVKLDSRLLLRRTMLPTISSTATLLRSGQSRFLNSKVKLTRLTAVLLVKRNGVYETFSVPCLKKDGSLYVELNKILLVNITPFLKGVLLIC